MNLEMHLISLKTSQLSHNLFDDTDVRLNISTTCEDPDIITSDFKY